MRWPIGFIIFASGSAYALSMTGEQFNRMLEQAQFVIATWHGILGVVIFSLASLLWRRINTNEQSTAAEFKDLNQYIRHEIRDLNNALRQSMDLIITQSKALQERHDRLLDHSANLQQELTTLRERIRRIEEK